MGTGIAYFYETGIRNEYTSSVEPSKIIGK